jgi:hypothetical protein
MEYNKAMIADRFTYTFQMLFDGNLHNNTTLIVPTGNSFTVDFPVSDERQLVIESVQVTGGTAGLAPNYRGVMKNIAMTLQPLDKAGNPVFANRPPEFNQSGPVITNQLTQFTIGMQTGVIPMNLKGIAQLEINVSAGTAIEFNPLDQVGGIPVLGDTLGVNVSVLFNIAVLDS